jgi:dTDP-4-amino-4,6-dideoxygalactose transaminase
VVTVSHTFIATADAVRLTGATPVFVDVDPGTVNLDPRLLDDALSPTTAAVLCVHQLGMPADLSAILAVAERVGVPVVEDAACALGSEIRWAQNWERIGRPHGVVACFSFHPRKILTTGDGGMVTTGDPDIDRRVRRARVHGMDVSAHERHAATEVVVATYEQAGFNFRLTDIQAAIGRVQLGRLPGMVAARRDLAARYDRLLDDLDAVTRPTEPAWARTNWQSYRVRLADGLDQREVMQGLWDRGVANRPGVMCVHREPAYPPGSWRPGSPLVESERAQDHDLLLPLHPTLTEAEQVAVADALREVVR